MIILSKKLTPAIFLLAISQTSYAMNPQVLSSVRTHQADATTRSQLLSILESCDVPNDNADVNCILQGLQAPNANIKNPSMATNIIDGYKAALNYKMNNPKCQIPDMITLNQATADCVFVLHYTILESSDPTSANEAYNGCILRKSGNLSLQGNLAAQFTMKAIAENSGNSELSQIWTTTLYDNNDPKAVQEMANCF